MKKVLIIGGNSDIGFSLGCQFVKSNFKLILASRNLIELQIKKKLYKRILIKIAIFISSMLKMMK